MTRWMKKSAVVLAVLAVTAPGAVAPAKAAPADGAVCTTFSASGLKLQWSVIGSVTCKQAKPWLVKIVSHRGTPNTKAVIKNGPKRFHCSASNDNKGRPFAGACYTGTLAYPTNGFQWLG